MPELQSRTHPHPHKFPIVGIGASAGGLDAFKLLLNELPSNTGMAFVLIQHLDPKHTSVLTEVLTKESAMPLQQIQDGTEIEPNHIYVIPADSDIGILRGVFTLFPRDKESHKTNMAIDFFFQSLAADARGRAIGVILSGAANDGTEGLRAIKANNGVTLVQDPKTAAVSSMPQSAINAEVADFCLAIPELVRELVNLSKHPHLSGRLPKPFSDPKDAQELKQIFTLLKTTGVDLSEYKSATITRRLARRMALVKIVTLSEYIKLLQSKPAEIKALASDVLIHVTSFFRDPDVFERLKTSVFPEILKTKSRGSPIRIWVTGCSSGEEVYSIMIALVEFLGEQQKDHPIQMFGSDMSERMIDIARAGVYSEQALSQMDETRLQHYFVKIDGGYRINSTLRSSCVFVKHDLSRDPPFSKIDLVTCRNVLIYFEQSLQKKLISIFHYCLNQPGFLLLGKTESVSSTHRLFSTVDKVNKIFMRSGIQSTLRFTPVRSQSPVEKQRPQISIQSPVSKPAVDVAKQVDNLLLAQYAPAGVVVNERMDILQYRGKTGPYLEAPPGQPQVNLLKMIREGLFATVKMGVDTAKSKTTMVRKDNVSFKQNGIAKLCNIVITPIADLPDAKEPLFLILFEEVIAPKKPLKEAKLSFSAKVRKLEELHSEQAAKLEHELRSTQEYLQSLNEEHQRANDTLNSVNEEFVSGNEELQSMNEELETAKEELQSTNEELTTVNEELQNRIHETAGVNDDLINLLNSAEIPIMILDMNRRIRRFTPKAKNIMNLLPTDIGRQIDDIKPNIKVENLDEQIQHVIESDTTEESEVQDRQGKWHRIQIRPYKTIDNITAGAVVSLVNIDVLRRAVTDAEWVRDYATNLVEAVQMPLLVLDEEMNIISANQIFYDDFQAKRRETESKSLFEVSDGQWNIGTLKTLLTKTILNKTSFQNHEVNTVCKNTGNRVMLISARPIKSGDDSAMILLSIEDVTDRKNREKERKELLRLAQKAKEDADRANLAKDMFLATLSHELRTPLTSLILSAQMLQRGTLDDVKIKKASKAIERAAKTQTQLIGDLLDVSRIVTGKLKMEMSIVNLQEVTHAAIETVTSHAETKSIQIELYVEAGVYEVSGDATRLQQVIWNLLNNAIKFTAAGGQIEVHLKIENERANLKVIDHGIGISPEFLPHVFNRFSQEESSSTRTHGGLGLGLAIVKHLVEMHEGYVNVESEGPGKGAIFSIALPLISKVYEQSEFSVTKVGITHPQQKHPAKTKNAPLSGLRILIVEDDTDARETITEMLDQAGVDVRAADSAKEALKVLKDFTPDGLVMDISMPEENGYQLLSRIRRLDLGGKKIPALALTALASERDREDAFAAGFQMHLTKPIDIDKLTGAILELRDRHSAVH